MSYSLAAHRYDQRKVELIQLIFLEDGFPGGSVVKNPPGNARDTGSSSDPGRPPGEGYDNPLQYSCLENFMDRRAWLARVHEVAKNQTQLTN